MLFYEVWFRYPETLEFGGKRPCWRARWGIGDELMAVQRAERCSYTWAVHFRLQKRVLAYIRQPGQPQMLHFHKYLICF